MQGLRLVWYPYLILLFHRRITSWGAAAWSYHWWQTAGAQFALSALNYFWTAELLWKMLRPKKKKKKNGTKKAE